MNLKVEFVKGKRTIKSMKPRRKPMKNRKSFNIVVKLNRK